MPVSCIVWDTEFRVSLWNPMAERIFGYPAREAHGKHPYQLIVPREVRPQINEIWTRLLSGDKTAHSMNERGEHRFSSETAHPDGITGKGAPGP